MKRKILSDTELADALTTLDDWEAKGKEIRKRWKFDNFADALVFVNNVGTLAEAADHHPDITFGWGYAELALTTHDRGGITDVDINLADKINKI